MKEERDSTDNELWVPSWAIPFPQCIESSPTLKDKVLANQLTEQEQVHVRRLVSREKRRFQQDGHDLDLTYLTKRIIAMGCPAFHCERLYRNPAEHVISFMEQYHQNHYYLYNLCIESNYDSSIFQNRVNTEFQFYDHHPPPFSHLIPFCKSVDQWLAAHENNVVCIHCKAGKGRTGVMSTVYLLWTSACNDAHHAIQTFGVTRTLDGSGITLPSQIRFVNYFDTCLKRGQCPQSDQVISIQRILLHRHGFDSNAKNQLTISCSKKTVYLQCHIENNNECIVVLECDNLKLQGDIQLSIHEDESEFSYLWFNTNFLSSDGADSNSVLKLTKGDIDGPHKDKHHKKYDENIAIEIVYHVVQPTVWRDIHSISK
jgi:phosphatidylinositol-3,4,5-trisphosphate 3-phosphatase/dual-specificity protein phosphatase PTEN